MIATAGHVDHGKSALIRAITGIDPDRYQEEQARGLTLDLGFAHVSAPDGTLLDIVDVPGHEDLLRTMIAGAAHATVALLVIDAVEGPRTQTFEHLRVLDGANVPVGVVALTRCDLVDEQRAAEAEAETSIALDGSNVRWTTIVRTSSISGAGLDDLIAALAETSRLADSQSDAPRDRPARMVIDRSFHVAGAGTVVTGTLDSGRLVRGQRVQLRGRAVTVRQLQRNGSDVESVSATARCAINLTGIEVESVNRGDVLTEPDRWASTTLIDGRLVRFDEGSFPNRAEIHLAGARRHASFRPVGGSLDLVRVRFDEPLPLRPTDRFVVRSIGSGRAIASVEVLDVAPVSRPSRSKPDGSREKILVGHGWLRLSEAAKLVGEAVDEVVPGWVAAGSVVAATTAELHARLALGAVSTAVLTEPERLLIARFDGVVVEHGEARLGSRDPALDHPVVDRVRSEGVTPSAIIESDRGVVARLIRLGVFFAHDNIAFHREVLDGLRPTLTELWNVEPNGFTISELRSQLGITRKHAVPLAECLDAAGLTGRVGDRRVRGRAF